MQILGMAPRKGYGRSITLAINAIRHYGRVLADNYSRDLMSRYLTPEAERCGLTGENAARRHRAIRDGRRRLEDIGMDLLDGVESPDVARGAAIYAFDLMADREQVDRQELKAEAHYRKRMSGFAIPPELRRRGTEKREEKRRAQAFSHWSRGEE